MPGCGQRLSSVQYARLLSPLISTTCVGVLLARALPINIRRRNARRCSGGFMSLILVFARKWVGWYRLLRYRKAFSFAASIRYGLWLARG